MHFIDRLGLYPTILANHQDDVGVDTSSWSLAYDSVEKVLSGEAGSSADARAAVEGVRSILIRDASETYYAWVIAMFAPWSTVPARENKGPKAKPLPPRAVEVARDSLRSDNKTMSILSDAVNNSGDIINVKSSLLESSISGTTAEIRQKVGLHIRSWKKDWRLCMLLAVLQEIMRGEDFFQGRFNFHAHSSTGSKALTFFGWQWFKDTTAFFHM